MAAGRRPFPVAGGAARSRALGTHHHACLEPRCLLGAPLLVTDRPSSDCRHCCRQERPQRLPRACPAPTPRLYPPRGCGVSAWGMLALSLAFTLALALALTHAGVVSRFSCGVGALPKAPTPRVSASARARSPTLYPDHINLPPGPCSRLANANARLQGRTGELSLAGSPSLSPAPLAPRP